MNTVITIGREFGSGGRELGRKLAEHLGYAYYDNEILTAIVSHTELSENYINEVVEGKNLRLFPITVEHTFTVGCDYTIQQMQNVYRAQTEVIKEMAHRSNCVIVGRCADFILKDEDINLIRVFVYADIESRVKRCIERASEGEDTDPKVMKKKILKVDKGRTGYYEDYTLQRWGDKANYDICINTSNIDIGHFVDSFANMFR